MNELLVIGVGYKKQMGKDTIANRLVDKHGFVRIAFADALKEAAKAIFQFSDEQLADGPLKEKIDSRWNKSPRQILQEMGQGLRNIDEDIWIKAAVQRMEKAISIFNPVGIVIPDTRYPNEVDWIKGKHSRLNNLSRFSQGLVWKVDRETIKLNEFSGHSSEVSLDTFQDWDAVISNNDSIASLYSKVDNLIQNLQDIDPKRRSNDLGRRKG